MPMEPLHARYPFLTAAREAVREADVDLATVVADEEPVVERAAARVRAAIESGAVGAEHRAARVELLSYPVARVLVSLVDEPGLVHRYARAEARTALDRFAADRDRGGELRSVDRPRLALSDLLRGLGLDESVRETSDGFAVSVATYLRVTDDLGGERWRLCNRALADGTVTVSREEGFDLLREAVRDRVAAGLPLDVPEPIAEPLAGVVADLRSRIADLDPDWDIDAVEPPLFPPCVAALIDRVDDGEDLPAHSRFALASFLSSIGVDRETLRDRYGLAGYQLDHLRDGDGGGRSVYPPPSCAAMDAYGDCVNRDALCEAVSHPLDYYERRLRGDDAVLGEAQPSRAER